MILHACDARFETIECRVVARCAAHEQTVKERLRSIIEITVLLRSQTDRGSFLAELSVIAASSSGRFSGMEYCRRGERERSVADAGVYENLYTFVLFDLVSRPSKRHVAQRIVDTLQI